MIYFSRSPEGVGGYFHLPPRGMEPSPRGAGSEAHNTPRKPRRYLPRYRGVADLLPPPEAVPAASPCRQHRSKDVVRKQQ